MSLPELCSETPHVHSSAGRKRNCRTLHGPHKQHAPGRGGRHHFHEKTTVWNQGQLFSLHLKECISFNFSFQKFKRKKTVDSLSSYDPNNQNFLYVLLCSEQCANLPPPTTAPSSPHCCHIIPSRESVRKLRAHRPESGLSALVPGPSFTAVRPQQSTYPLYVPLLLQL